MWTTARGDVTVGWQEHGSPGWTLLDGADDIWVDLTRGGHYSFIGVCTAVDLSLLETLGINVTDDGCGPDFTPLGEIIPAVLAYTHAFGRVHVLGQSEWGALFDQAPLHPDIVTTRRR